MSEAPSGPKKQFADLRLRVLAAIGLAVVSLMALWLGGWILLVFAAMAACVMLLELNSMCQNRGDLNANSGYAVVVGGTGAVMATYFGFWPVVGALLVTMLVAWLLNARRVDLRSSAIMVVIVMASAAIYELRESQGFWVVLWIALCVVAADTGGYLFGRAFGGPKLSPRISPKKTWSGFLGGILLTVIVALIFSASLDGGTIVYTIFAVIIAFVALVGDLCESAAKRYYGVKDSGTIVPGHGGLMDRFDGLSLVLVFFYVVSAFGNVGLMLGNG